MRTEPSYEMPLPDVDRAEKKVRRANAREFVLDGMKVAKPCSCNGVTDYDQDGDPYCLKCGRRKP